MRSTTPLVSRVKCAPSFCAPVTQSVPAPPPEDRHRVADAGLRIVGPVQRHGADVRKDPDLRVRVAGQHAFFDVVFGGMWCVLWFQVP